MGDDDVPPSPGPTLGTSPGRFILQHFVALPDAVASVCPHNKNARLPDNMSQFLPPTIVDMLYGSTAIMQWGVPEATKAIRLSAQSLYYDGTGSGGLNLSREAEDEEDDTEAIPVCPPPVESARSKRAKKWAS
jgi:hypothetical protein